EAKEIFVSSLTRPGRAKRNGTLVYNIDDERVGQVAARFEGEKLSFGLSETADIRAIEPEADLDGTRFGLSTPDGDVDVELKLLGRISIYNALAAAGAACALSLPLAAIKAGLEAVDSVPGRFQVIRSDGGPVVVVDYAHTPDALESLLSFCRELGPRNLITVFGCGGDRDRGKRPQMGRIAAQLSDRVYVTSDNPRSEDPGSIIEEILSGIGNGQVPVISLEDRAEAIRTALSQAGEGDLVVIAGKGHEDYQILGNRKIHFSDTEQAIGVLRDLEVGYQD
ncbi:MAG TPA: UDP-N-acetylmuramyl-tripeptide synthetase, partial [Candidatus Krumholzibacterium sp.]|nr:UDP-N-acetylmuramyl-tripeptide synthetase [Candidatus Krumholzibacterium sp.]